ncbi:kinase-like domain-containing protein [Hysterangium stoloniferum]|nr:kinase-like domain-containing protein [Hysterangium stoloniferum]
MSFLASAHLNLLAMQQIFKAAQKLSGLSRTVPFTRSQQVDLFKYTSGRWLYNEEEQTALRYVEFDVDEIQHVACAAVGAKRCVSLKKLGEGSYNKVFALNFDNGMEAIVRFPTALAGAPFFTTASEVATLEFVREVLGIHAPRVFAWNADATAGSVGAEYIIMEKLSGVESHNRWLHIAKAPQVSPLLNGVFDIECKFECAPFSQIGSLYFRDDVPADLRDRPLFRPDSLPSHNPELLRKLDAAKEKYRIGPIADRQWWRSERAEMIYDHGPWPDMGSFSILGLLSMLLTTHPPDVAVSHLTTPTTHIKLLDMLALAIPHIIPPHILTTPTLWHADLSHSNLLVAEEGPAEVRGLIDWQHSTIAPYCMQATFPSLFTYDGGLIDIPTGRVPPKLPSHVSMLSSEQQELYRIHLKLAMRHKVYEQKIVEENERRNIACAMPFGAELALLPYRVLRSWSDSPVLLRQALLDLRNVWDKFAHEDTQCPIHFTDNEVRNHDQEFQQYNKYQTSITSLDDKLESEFSRALTALKEREGNWDDKANGGSFPYKDGSFSFFLS